MHRERIFWLSWSQISGIGPILLKRLHQKFGSLETAWQASSGDLRQVEGFGEQVLKKVLEGRSHLDPIAFYQQHSLTNPNFWTPADPEYPRLLLEIPDPPPVLYYRGQVDLAENRGIKPLIAIVGTRDPSDYGKRWTCKISTALAASGFTVVSGMAEGIDTEAHSASLYTKGRTIAVLGTGVDIVYPPRNRNLHGQIQEYGLIVSEYPAGTQPNRPHFPRRNRIIAGLSRATIVMEAPSKSGALITAYLANDYCRDVYVLPGSLDNPKAIGCLGLLSKGAQIFLNEGHLLEMLGKTPKLDAPQQLSLFNPPVAVPTLPPRLQSVFDVISSEATSFDLIIEKSGLAAGEVSSALLELELEGAIAQLPGMRYQKT
ncbi:DNA-processing protein DprA [Merismopedia glauca]|uniref:DNA-protecting protein DprA n=1 Tax=Merismopedia glauca CCAP 1448/3 TaxID=1296344 RepID=A0A2T1C0J1_9CYAN|nr:DNA-processing protein DprA [Merismopedia glauca]PSB01688.1 DNA-protecting protein DprA [Merismopedia glauca CCAP 1448/3]